jgi:hypothetical protein
MVFPPPLRYRFRWFQKRHHHRFVTWLQRPSANMAAMHHQPDSAAFDVVLLLHVACAVVGLVTTVTAAATASRLRRLILRGTPLSEALRRYFRPGVNWAGRTIYGIPVFGFALLAMSQGAYALGDGWVLGGVAVFAAVALVAEGVLWPAERRLQAVVARVAGGSVPGGPGVSEVSAPLAAPSDAAADLAAASGDAVVMARAADVALVLLLAGVVLMIAQP